jgi:hydroxymethylpyrimidine pyrophosphatase-like HAD family hydrolase
MQGVLSGKVLAFPMSSTGQQAYISIHAMDMLSRLKTRGFLVVLISGARTSTCLERLPYLPDADAVITENGGRIFFKDASWKSFVPLREDLKWRQQLMPVTGAFRGQHGCI